MPHLLFRYEITVYSTSHAPNKEMMKRRNRRAVIASWHTLLCASEYYYYFAPSNLFHRRIDSSTLCLYAFWRIYIFVDSTLNSHVHSYELQIDLTCDICTLFELDLGARGSEVVNIKIYLIRWWCYDEDAYKESEREIKDIGYSWYEKNIIFGFASGCKWKKGEQLSIFSSLLMASKALFDYVSECRQSLPYDITLLGLR